MLNSAKMCQLSTNSVKLAEQKKERQAYGLGPNKKT